VLVLDDDFVFCRRTRLLRALVKLERHPEIDLLGGDVVSLPLFRRVDYAEAELLSTARAARFASGHRLGGLPVMDKVPNFFIARTERLRLVDWDPSLKRLDHADFFTRARGVLVSVLDRELVCLHAQTPFDRAYMQKRADYAADVELLRQRYFAGEPTPAGVCKER
jgi:hypothetical protein